MWRTSAELVTGQESEPEPEPEQEMEFETGQEPEPEQEMELGPKQEQEQEEDMDYKISESEWLLMEQLWQGEMTQAQLAEHLGKKWNKNTIHTFLTRLCKKGFAEVDRERSPHVYRAAVPREACEKQERESFLQSVYRGNVGNMVASFVKDNRLSAREAEALRKLLDECRRQETEPE